MGRLFISHSSRDDDFVRELRVALADQGQDGWIDSRELRGGDPLWTDIQKAIEEASAYAVVVSTDSLQSKWVGKELTHALKLRDERGNDSFPVIPIMRIDYVWASAEWQIVDAWVGDDAGSDHLPVLARIQLPPALATTSRAAGTDVAVERPVGVVKGHEQCQQQQEKGRVPDFKRAISDWKKVIPGKR